MVPLISWGIVASCRSFRRTIFPRNGRDLVVYWNVPPGALPLHQPQCALGVGPRLDVGAFERRIQRPGAWALLAALKKWGKARCIAVHGALPRRVVFLAPLILRIDHYAAGAGCILRVDGCGPALHLNSD